MPYGALVSAIRGHVTNIVAPTLPIFYDTFTGAGNLVNHLPEIGGAWANGWGFDGWFPLVAGSVKIQEPPGWAYNDCGQSDIRILANLSVGNHGFEGRFFFRGDTNNTPHGYSLFINRFNNRLGVTRYPVAGVTTWYYCNPVPAIGTGYYLLDAFAYKGHIHITYPTGTFDYHDSSPVYPDTKIGIHVNSSDGTPNDVYYLDSVSIWTVTGKTLTVLGDSISSLSYGNLTWPERFEYAYNGGKTYIWSRSISGEGILMAGTFGNLAAQIAAAAGDNSDIVIIAVGTNDSNLPADQAALIAAIESGIDDIRAAMPAATIYYMNVLPRFDGVNVGNIRNSIITACATKGVLVWDTYTDPWIEAADTSDNLHPNAAGAEKIKNRVMALI